MLKENRTHQSSMPGASRVYLPDKQNDGTVLSIGVIHCKKHTKMLKSGRGKALDFSASVGEEKKKYVLLCPQQCKTKPFLQMRSFRTEF